MPAPLASSFLPHVPAAARDDFARAPDLEEWLQRVSSDAEAAWPGVVPAREIFMAHLGTKMERSAPAMRSLPLRTSDLFLACMAAHGDAAALAHFDARYLSQIDGALGRMKLSATVADDVKAALRTQLFVRDGDRAPLVLQYGGRGDLGSWVRSVAVRAALKQVRRERASEPADDELGQLAEDATPELAYLRRLYAAEVKSALVAVLAGLPTRQRNLLKQHHLDGLNVDDLGVLYRVHRATAARWLVAAREAVVGGMRQTLAARLAVSDETLESVIQLARDELDLSLSRVFREPSP